MIDIVYTCPQCGADLKKYIICTYPSTIEYKCWNCGFTKEEETDPVTIIRTPFPVQQQGIDNYTISNSPCDHCSNSPKNGGSGICSCTLNPPKIT